MKAKSLLIRISEEEIKEINKAYKKELINNELISRSEFVRRLLRKGLEEYKEK